ncbi:MAG: xanthine dehydrogenase family protein subunit M [Desulfatiglandales bacterium]|jgi:carbon-monoxide dehydrogenase medium subunit|nr:xanthine dehydrogenase family protein subunit M [Desulfatiglandales bacterium]
MVTFYRRLPNYDYVKPESIEEALTLMNDNQERKYKVYAGGTDVITKLKQRLINTPQVLIDLKGIPGLDYIDYDEKNGLRIGALATIHSVAQSALVREKFTLLSQAAESIASNQIQNRGTIAGNICNAVPSADSAPALLTLGANLLCVSKNGERTIPIDKFFTGPNETALRPDELLKEIQVPDMPKNSNGVYIKLSPRRKMDLAVVGVAAIVSKVNGLFGDIRIGLGAVAPTPIRAKKAEEMLNGEKVADELILKAAQVASEESKPIDDHRASARYRAMMVEVLVKRAIHQALSN